MGLLTAVKPLALHGRYDFNSGLEIIIADLIYADKCQFINCQFNDNESTGTMTVMNGDDSDSLLVESCTFNNNSAAQGSVEIFKGGTIGSIIRSSLYFNNSGDIDCTIIDLDSTSTGNMIAACNMSHNSAASGDFKGIYLAGAGNMVKTCRVIDNDGTTGQAGIVVSGDNNTVVQCGLFANGNWDGIIIENSADETTVKNCLIFTHAGYGIDNQGSNSIIVGNAAENNDTGDYNNANALSFFMTGTNVPQTVYEYDNVTFTL